MYKHSFTMGELTTLNFNWVEIASMIGSFATVGAFLFLFHQNAATQEQQFESTFFHLINLHNEIIDQLEGGRGFFKTTVGNLQWLDRLQLSDEILDDSQGFYIPGRQKDVQSIEEARLVIDTQYVSRYYSRFDISLNHYFRNIYYMLKFLDQSPLIKKKRKRFFAGLFRAQLSQNELHTLMYNVIHKDYGYPKALYLVNKYDLLQNMDRRNVNAYFLELYEDRIKSVDKDHKAVVKGA